MRTVLGIDLGTQSVKAILYSPSSKTILSSTSHPLDLIARDDGTREQHPDCWVAALTSCLSKIPDSLRASVAAISVSGQQHGFVPLDVNGKVLGPAKLWCDTTTVSECDELIANVGKEECLRTVGAITTGFTAPKVLWMKKRRPRQYHQLHTIMLPHDYLNFYLTEQRVAECGDASGTALLDVRTRSWSNRMLRALDSDLLVDDCLPRLIQAHEPAGVIVPHVARTLGLPDDVIVAAGGGDNMMAAIGTGNVIPGRLTASMGTSGTLFAYSDKPVVDESGSLASFCSSTGGWLPLLCTMNCTVATEQLRSLLAVDLEAIDDMVSKVEPGCDGVITLPFYNGERFPDLPNGKAMVYGLDMGNTTRGHLMRSAMEAALFGLRCGLEAFGRQGMHFEEVTITGGGSASGQWRQMCADILKLRVRVLKQTENAALGAALQALWCYGHHRGNAQTIEDITEEHLDEDVEKRCCPIVEHVCEYDAAYARYMELLQTMTPLLSKGR